MLGSIRKFSTSIYAKILLAIVVIPFVFWGMGGTFSGGKQNIVVTIDKDKYSIEEFGNFLRLYVSPNEKISNSKIEELLALFIGEKLIEKEVQRLGIKLSDRSLGNLIMNQKDFKRDNKFSRIEYEKFLLKHNITPAFFESNLSVNEKKKQLLDLIGGGVSSSDFLISETYNRINQKRNVEIINLNDAFKEKITFTENQIKSFYEENKDKYYDLYKSIYLIELNPKKLTGNDEYTDSFFKKIDEIEDSIIRGENIKDIVRKNNLEAANSYNINKKGNDITSNKVVNLTTDIVDGIFKISNSESITLIESKEKYYVVEIIKSENVQKTYKDEEVRNDILNRLEINSKRKLIANLVDKVNKNNFIKSDFDNFSKSQKTEIRKIRLENLNDEKKLKSEIIQQIYSASEKTIIIVHDIGFNESYLIYIDKIENVNIDKNSDLYRRYFTLSNNKIRNDLYNTYDNYIKKRYKIDINNQALNKIKNYFN